MSTNYYHRTNICEHCGRSDERVHIGKSSIGWPFHFHAITDEANAIVTPDSKFDSDFRVEYPVVVATWEQWKERLLADGDVVDEYGATQTAAEFIAYIEARANPPVPDPGSAYVDVIDCPAPGDLILSYHHQHGRRLSWFDGTGHLFCAYEFC